MDWNRLQRDWQTHAPQTPPPAALAAVQARDDKLRATLRRRDVLETAVGLLVAPVFAYGALRAGQRGEAWQAFFSAFLALWALFVPWQLWRTRRRLPTPRAERSLLEFLRESRAAMVAQARQLERIWVWYLAPCAFGVIGLMFAARGPDGWTWTYAVIVLVFCAGLARLNRYAARTQFRVHVDEIERQLALLTEEPPP